MGIAEGFGGIAVLVFCIARFLVGVVESRLMESELISNFYQIEKPHTKFFETKARPDAPPLPKGIAAPKVKLKHGIHPVNDEIAA